MHFRDFQVQTRRTLIIIGAAITDYNPPRFNPSLSSQLIVSSIADQSVVLPCHAYDRSPDTSNVEISWQFENVTLNTNNYLFRSGSVKIIGKGNLYFPNIQSKHAGKYKCVAKNANGQIESNMRLKILGLK